MLVRATILNPAFVQLFDSLTVPLKSLVTDRNNSPLHDRAFVIEWHNGKGITSCGCRGWSLRRLHRRLGAQRVGSRISVHGSRGSWSTLVSEEALIVALIALIVGVILAMAGFALARYMWTTPLPQYRFLQLVYVGAAIDVIAVVCICLAIVIWLGVFTPVGQ